MAKGVNGIPTNVADKLMTDYLTPLADSDTETVYRERKMALLNSTAIYLRLDLQILC